MLQRYYCGCCAKLEMCLVAVVIFGPERARRSSDGPPSFRGGGILAMPPEANCDCGHSVGAGAGRGHLGANMRW